MREVVERTGQPMPNGLRVVSTLDEEGFLERTEAGVLHPGVAGLTLGSAALRTLALQLRVFRVDEQPTGD